MLVDLGVKGDLSAVILPHLLERDAAVRDVALDFAVAVGIAGDGLEEGRTPCAGSPEDETELCGPIQCG